VLETCVVSLSLDVFLASTSHSSPSPPEVDTNGSRCTDQFNHVFNKSDYLTISAFECLRHQTPDRIWSKEANWNFEPGSELKLNLPECSNQSSRTPVQYSVTASQVRHLYPKLCQAIKSSVGEVAMTAPRARRLQRSIKYYYTKVQHSTGIKQQAFFAATEPRLPYPYNPTIITVARPPPAPGRLAVIRERQPIPAPITPVPSPSWLRRTPVS
jgi:hypothetical protein